MLVPRIRGMTLAPRYSHSVATDQVERRHRDTRLRRAFLATISTRALGLIGTLALTPVLTRHLTLDQYGVLVTLTTASTVMGLSDLGVANSLISRIAVFGWDSPRTRQLLCSATALLLGAVLLGTLVAGVLSLALPWPVWLRAPSLSAHELRLATFFSLLGVAVGVGTSLGQKLELARQRGQAVALWSAVANLSGPLAAVATATASPHLIPVVAASALAPPLVLGVQTWRVLWQLPRGSRPDPRRATREDVRMTLSAGGAFMLLSIATFTAFQVDTLIVSGVLGASVAAVFSLVVRLFGLVSVTVQNSIAQLWATFADAISKGDREYVHATLRRWVMLCGGITGAASVGLIAVGRPFISAWAGPNFVPSWHLLLAAAAWYTYSAAAAPLLLLFNGAQLLRVQLSAVVPMAVLNVVLSLVFTRALGAAGPLWGSLLSHVLCVGIPLVWYFRQWSSTRAWVPTNPGPLVVADASSHV